MTSEQAPLQVHVGPPTPGGREVRLVNRRPLQAMRLAEGRSATEALRLLPLVFGVCAHAHRAAAADALGHALGADAPARDTLHRQARLESLREHLLHIHRDWPLALDLAPADDEPAQALRLVQSAGHSAGLRALLDWITRHTLGMPPRRWLEMDHVDDLRRWALRFDGAAPRLLRDLLERTPTPCLAPLDALEDLPPDVPGARLAAPDAMDFAHRPQLAGACLETGPAARRRRHALLGACAGHGLLGRFAARLLDVAHTALELQRDEVVAPRAEAPGLGWVDCARGRLLHHAETDAQGRVLRYRIVAPTEWNTHPRGLCARLLGRIGAGASPAVHIEARMVMLAVDPCVAASVHLEHAGAALEPGHA